MARSGFNGGYGHNLQLEIISGGYRQNVAENYSMVNVQVRIVANGYASIYGAGGKTLSLGIGSQPTTRSVDASISPGQTKLIFEEEFRVPHNPDGTQRVYISARLDINVGGYGWAAAGEFVNLATIARSSTGSDVSGIIGQPLTFTIDRKNDSFKHAIWVKYGSFDKNISGNSIDTSFAWTPEMALCEQTPDATSGTGTVTYITYSDDKEIGRDARIIRLSVPDDVRPNLTGITLLDTNTAAARVVPGEQDFISILSNIKVGFGQTIGAYGSVITGYYAEIVGHNQSTNQNGGTLGIMDYNGVVTIRANVTDSRGRVSNTIEKQINVIEYFAPVLSFDVVRSGANSSTLTITRNAKIASLIVGGNQKNKMTLSFKVAPVNSENYVNDTGPAAGTWTTISSLTNSNANLQGTYASDTSWKIAGVLEDSFTSTPFQAVISTEEVVESLARDRVGFGKIAEKPNAIDSAWNIYAHGSRLGFYGAFSETTYSIDNTLTAGIYTFNNGCAGQPNGIKGWGYLQVIVAGGGNDSPTHNNWDNWIWQTYSNTFGQVFERYKVNNNGWTPWVAPGVNQFYPIGSIYQSTEATNPATFMGGTWERFGNGKVLVGADETDGDFSTVMRTGGAKTHDHGDGTYEAMIGANGGNTDSIGYQASNKNDDVLRNSTATYKVVGTSMGAGRNFNHFTRIAGRSAKSSNLPPYITIYRWRRIA